MLKEMVQMLVKDPGTLVRLQNGQLQLAGVSEVEHRALKDVLFNKEKGEKNGAYWY